MAKVSTQLSRMASASHTNTLNAPTLLIQPNWKPMSPASEGSFDTGSNMALRGFAAQPGRGQLMFESGNPEIIGVFSL